MQVSFSPKSSQLRRRGGRACWPPSAYSLSPSSGRTASESLFWSYLFYLLPWPSRSRSRFSASPQSTLHFCYTAVVKGWGEGHIFKKRIQSSVLGHNIQKTTKATQRELFSRDRLHYSFMLIIIPTERREKKQHQKQASLDL